MLTKEQIRSDNQASGHKFRRRGVRHAVALVVCGYAFSAPAIACVCSCSPLLSQGKDTAVADIRPAEYDQVFSGLVISTEHTDEPVAAAGVAGEKVVEDPGYWARSKILVLRTWRGTPSQLAEVWTPVVTDCDSPPIAGFYFVALVRSENGRGVANNSRCDCHQRAAATEGRGAFAVAGIAITAVAIGAAAIALLSLVKVIRRRRPRG